MTHDLKLAECEFEVAIQREDVSALEMARVSLQLGVAQSRKPDSRRIAESTLRKTLDIAVSNLGLEHEISIAATCHLGVLLSARCDDANSISWFAKGFAGLPWGSPLHIQCTLSYGTSLSRLRRYRDALNIFDTHMAAVLACFDDCEIAEALGFYGHCVALAGDLTFAIQLLNRAKTSGSDVVQKAADRSLAEVFKWSTLSTASEWKAIGNTAFNEGNLDAAVCLYASGLKLDPANAVILANQALCLYKLGALRDALRAALESLNADSTYKRACVIAINCCLGCGLKADAIDYCRRLATIDPSDKLHEQLVAKVEATSEGLPNPISESPPNGAVDELAEPPTVNPDVVAGSQMLARLREALASRGAPYFQWAQSCSQQELANHLKSTCTFLEPSSEESRWLLSLCPELSLERLTERRRLRAFVEGIAAVESFLEMLCECARSVVDFSKLTRTARGTWLAGQIQAQEAAWIDPKSGYRYRKAAVDGGQFSSQVMPLGVYCLAMSRATHLIELPLSWLSNWSDGRGEPAV